MARFGIPSISAGRYSSWLAEMLRSRRLTSQAKAGGMCVRLLAPVSDRFSVSIDVAVDIRGKVNKRIIIKVRDTGEARLREWTYEE
jgi:hypothetical protein